MNTKNNKKAKRITIISLAIVAVLALVLGPIAWLATPGLRTPVQVAEPDYWPTAGWRTSTPEEQGYSSEKMAQALQDIQKKGLNVDSLLIIHNGYLVLDTHFDPYDGTFYHDLASVTKSVMTTLIAIASEQGKIDLDAPMVSFFPNRTIANLDERKMSLTVRDLASMRNGMESGCYDGDPSTIQAMTDKPDWVQAALDRRMSSEPGKQFCYDSPGMHILSAILQEATGMTTFDFARQNLFEPLGIQDVLWEADPQGYSYGGGDLHLLPEDAAKIGYLWLHQGNWNGKQIVPQAWVLDSVRRHSTKVNHDSGYGYGWWINMSHYFAAGRGGQEIRVIPALNTVVVMTGGEYDVPELIGLLTPILLQSSRPRPANPEGLAALESALAAVEQGAAAWTTKYTPVTAAQISGKPYRCEDNPAGIEAVNLEFDGSDQARFFLKMGGVDMILPIGLDGSYRLNSDGTGYRGYWEDMRTFHLEAFDIGLLSRQVLFDGDRMQISLPEAGLTVTCQIQKQ